ncbi:MAG TPA: glycosyltransferase [Candidatus Saccharimonadia bacterium]|nr:glycosyltransferase [Candidatus Saccharimonadia bacterium]
MNTPKIAIVYDRVNKFGGAERVLESLHQAFPNAPLYTSVFNAETAPWAKGWDVRTTFLQRFSFARKHHEWLGWLMPLAFESLNFDAFDLVISVTSEAAKGIVTKPHTKHLSYVLTPTRYLWSKSDEYKHAFLKNWWSILFYPGYLLSTRYLRWWDVVAAQRPDRIIPISYVVQGRCLEYYHRTTDEPIYPPIQYEALSKPSTVRPIEQPYFLVVSRLVPYKRVELAVQACLKRGSHLVIVGTGTELGYLRRVANNSPLIHFHASVSDADLAGYYQHCMALLFPGEEDFGLTALEVMAAGRPAIVYEKSGNAELIEDGKTGIVLHSQTLQEMISSLDRVQAVQWEGSALQSRAKALDAAQFIRRWRAYGTAA